MVVIGKVTANETLLSTVEAYTPENFKNFGSAMSIDQLIPMYPNCMANQGSAIKLPRIATLESDYPESRKGNVYFDIFRSKFVSEKWESGNYKLGVFERHPHTTQTFIPMGCNENENAYVVFVCPDINGSPDWKNLKSFICKGTESVTYGKGVWHTPMVVLKDKVDFMVVMDQNDVAEDCCLEVEIEGLYVAVNDK
ncbi:ureidoglycolate hydrolase [Martiniozyma asiatica (nom. inval.)]|nr:ureidoglycolate hydrolase [Martiniozyma asiatica]